MNFSIQHPGWGIACDTNEYERAGRNGNSWREEIRCTLPISSLLWREWCSIHPSGMFPHYLQKKIIECVAASSPSCQLEGNTLRNLRLLRAIFLPQRSSYVNVCCFCFGCLWFALYVCLICKCTVCLHICLHSHTSMSPNSDLGKLLV